ncbi:hypothetical protein [Vibrio hyugaensis]|uniref:hypothetical protein n=1 Tax=Vibrio hyugaensis TaxID=1534743 RepID=UPI000CE4732D|nr:hypothetical protein [Vibrio hyugaensis]
MRLLILVALTLTLTLILGFVSYFPSREFSGPLWESDEVILSQNIEIDTGDSAKFNLVKADFTLLYFKDGKYTASITAVVDYKDGSKESVTQEFIGSWSKQGRYVDMRIDDQYTVMGYPDDEVLLKRINYYARVALEQTYIISYYEGRLVLVSPHRGGPMLTLFKRER